MSMRSFNYRARIGRRDTERDAPVADNDRVAELLLRAPVAREDVLVKRLAAVWHKEHGLVCRGALAALVLLDRSEAKVLGDRNVTLK